MASSAVANALAFILVTCQSYFHWSSDNGKETNVHSSQTYLKGQHHLAGLILARGGSKGIPKKNMVMLHGKPLIYWALNAMKHSEVFTTIWVSTDDTDTSHWVEKEFPEVHVHQRSIYSATDVATSLTAVLEFLSFHPEVDTVGLVQATSPFVQPAYLQQASILLSKHDSVFSAYRSKSLRWRGIDNSHKEAITQPLNFDPKHRPRRQDWDGEMVENGMFYFTMRDVLVNDNVFQGPRVAYVEVPQLASLEIDTPKDLELADLLMKSDLLSLKKDSVTNVPKNVEKKSKSDIEKETCSSDPHSEL